MEKTIDLEEKKKLVAGQECFRLLTDEEITELTSLFVEEHIKAGNVIVTEGEVVDSVYLIVQGIAEVRHVWVDNGVIRADKLAELTPIQAIGLSETGLYSLTGRRTATVVAKTDMVVLRMSVTLFNGFVLSHSNVSKTLHAAAEERAARELNSESEGSL